MTDRATLTPDATEIAAMIRRRDLSPTEAVDAAIARCEEMQPHLNFLVTPMFDAARERAKSGTLAGPYAGVPYLMKDMYDVAGVPTRWGARFTQFAPLPAATCAQVKAFEAAGLVVFGKTALGEFGWLPTTEPLAFGPTHNPWDPARSPGGSSGGSAAAVAAGVVPMADAADGGGSIRIPASACGLFGLKPTPRRLIGDQPGAGDVELTVEHCLSRSVRDSAGLFAATECTGADATYPPIGHVTGPSKRRLRVGFVFDSIGGQAPHADVRDGVERTAALLERMGHRVEATSWPIDGALLTADFLKFYQAAALGVAEAVRAAMGRQLADAMLEPLTVMMAQEASRVPAGELARAVDGLRVHRATYDEWLTRYDVILSPVLLTPPVETGRIAGDVEFETLQRRIFAYADYTLIHNVVGVPAMSVPLHHTEAGLPVGMQFGAARADERTLFELAYELEEAQPWAHRRPPLFATGRA